VLRTLRDFSVERYVLLSSVDVYNVLDDPAQNGEDAVIDPLRLSTYGFHKYIAEACVRRHAPRWLIVRLAGMVGPGLKKNPVFDVLHGRPLSIHPDSQYQFMSTDAAARAVWLLVDSGCSNRVVNVCGRGLISPREIAQLAGKPVVVAPEAEAAQPRIVHVNTRSAASMVDLPETRSTITEFVGRG
jgi:nucleoside-diphosphate-sugar epimerase